MNSWAPGSTAAPATPPREDTAPQDKIVSENLESRLECQGELRGYLERSILCFGFD